MISDEGVRLGVEAARRLAGLGCCEIGPGPTDAEFARIEQQHGFEFADDHRAFLAAGLPLNGPVAEMEGIYQPWPEWRDGEPDMLRKRLALTIDGVLFDVEYDEVWHPTWGARPAGLGEALETARRCMARVPKMVPVYGHRFLPAGRGTFGHPVLSIVQTDIIHYGEDLVDYLHQDFGGPGMDRNDPRWAPQATVPFWRDFL